MTSLIRRVGAALFALVAPLPLHALIRPGSHSATDTFLEVSVILATPVAGVLLLIPRFGTALLGRAILWTALLWMTLLSYVAHPPGWEPLFLGAASGAALLTIGTTGLEAAASSPRGFSPVALRGTLVAIVVMSMADGLALFCIAFASLEASRAPTTFLLGGAALMALAAFGLLRLRAWAFILNVVANVGIALGAWLLAYNNGVTMPKQLAVCLTVTALGQLLAGLPLVLGLARGRTKPSPELGKSGWAFTVVTLLVLLAMAVPALLKRFA